MTDEFKDKKVLLVDDDKDILTAMESSVSELGVQTITARDGNSAVELVEKEKPDLVVLDLMLPRRSGLLVMERLCKQPDRPKVVMVTGNLGQRHKTYAQALGVEVYLNKPFRLEVLVREVKNLLQEEVKQQ